MLLLTGGNTFIHGFPKALYAQLKEHGGRKVAHLKKIGVHKDRDTSAWRGGEYVERCRWCVLPASCNLKRPPWCGRLRASLAFELA